MSTCKTTTLWIAVTVAVLAGTMVQAQEKKIEDQDLLNLLNKVNQTPAETNAVVEEPSSPAPDEMDVQNVAEEPAEEIDVVAGQDGSDQASAAQKVDDLAMDSVDDAIGSSSENLISVRLNKVSLEDAITLFAQLSGANIIVPELTDASQISVNLKDVEWRPALQSILDTYDYELYQRVAGSNVYSVRRRPAGAPEPQVVETFVLKYATVPNAAALIRELLPPNATVSEFASRNMLVVKSTESSLGEVRSVLDSIDTVRQQVYIESKFMELTDDAQKDLGIDWNALQGYTVSAKNLSASTASNTQDSKTTTKFYDVSGNQYEAYSEAPQFIDDGAGGIVPFTSPIPTVTKMTTKTVGKINTAVLSASDFSLILSALEQSKGVNIVSNPKIIVANEEPANISIVRKEPNLKQERQQTAGAQGGAAIDNIVFTLDDKLPFFEYGIKLDVVPSINTSSNITVNINPSLTRKFADKVAGDNAYPIIDEKSIQTVFNLASGQTAAIGGLTEITEAEEEHKVPVLGSIPLLGRLFSWSQTVQGKDETIIFVTVGLANTQQLDAETGLPGDSELARRQVIKDRNNRKLRDQDRQYYQAKENDKLDDMMIIMERNEQGRIDQRDRMLQKEAEKAAK